MTDKRKLLLIDDDQNVLSALVMRLAKYYELVSTTDPTKAVAMARAERPDLVLCDIDMPEMSGGDVAEALAADPRTSAIPLVYLTGLVSPAETKESGGLVGGRPGIAKKASLQELLTLIEAQVPLQ